MTDTAATDPAAQQDPTEPKNPQLNDPWIDQQGVLRYWGGEQAGWVVYQSPPVPFAGADPQPVAAAPDDESPDDESPGA